MMRRELALTFLQHRNGINALEICHLVTVRDPGVAQRNFQLVLTALESNKPLSFRVRRCEGKAMLIDQLGLQR